MTDESKLSRCIRLLKRLYQEGDVQTRDVMALLTVDRQTAMRDLRSLQDAGIPIVPVGHGSRRRYRLQAKTDLGGGLEEVLARHVGRQVLENMRAIRSGGWLAVLKARISCVPDPAQLERRLVVLGEPACVDDGRHAVIGELLAAMIEPHALRVVLSDGAAARLLPLSLVWYRSTLVLIARDPATSVLRRIETEQIVAVEAGAPFVYPSDYDPLAHVQIPDGPAADSVAERVVIRFARPAATSVRSRLWQPLQSLRDLPDGGIELSLVACGRTLLPWVLEFGDQAEVVEPAWVRAEVVRRLEGALHRYRD